LSLAEPSAGAFSGREHCLPVRVYYEDTDFTGLVYHASYLRFFERGRTDGLRLIGVGHAELLARPDPAAFAVTRMTVEFLSAARIDDALIVHTLFQAVRGPRLFISQRITRASAVIAAAEVEAACIRADGRARRPPADLHSRLRPWLGAAQSS
jgi:acyl-CoA thioester hydrolase